VFAHPALSQYQLPVHKTSSHWYTCCWHCMCYS